MQVAQSCPTLCPPWTIPPWNSPSQNIRVGSLSLLQWIFPTQGSNPGLPHCRRVLCQLSHKGGPNNAEVDVFLELSCFFDDSTDVDNLISCSSAFSKSSLNIWKFTVHVLLKPGLENFEYYFASMWDECNCAVVWAFFGTAFLCNWNKNWPFSSLWPLLSFPNLLAYWV